MHHEPVSLFYSYAHEDEALRDELQGHLKILERRGLISAWHDRAIVAGQDWAAQIDQHLRQADLVLLLLSVDFVNSDYIWGTELKLAMQRQAEGSTCVVPIMLRPLDLQPEDFADLPFGSLMARQGLPRDLKPVVSWALRDEAWVAVARGLRTTVNDIRARRSVVDAFQPAPAPAPTPAAAAGPDPLLEQVATSVAGELAQAQAARGGAAMDGAAMRRQALQLVDGADGRRVLWVDDHPANNHWEAAALAKLQIEVVQATSTEAGLLCLVQARDSGEPFHLVISDWTREREAPAAGLALLLAMRDLGLQQPVVYYHGSSAGPRRAAVAAAAHSAGALGEAVLPAELLPLVLRGLGL